MQNDTTLWTGPGRAAAAARALRMKRWRTALATIGASLRTLLHRGRTRRALESLSDHDLRDIGLSRADAWREARKPFWLP
jgi:uncharacterized protein YjiS (DUF1127 family)